MTGIEGETAIIGCFLLGAGVIVAARSVALAAIAAATQAVFVAREAVEKNWVGGGITITAPNGRYLKPPPKAAQQAPPRPVTEPVPIAEGRAA